jgi:uncharacterized protein
MELKMQIPASRQVVEAYGDGGFRVTGVPREGSLLVLPEQTLSWSVSSMEDVTLESLQLLLDLGRETLDMVLLGCGPRMALPPKAARDAFQAAGITLEPMDTGAACRTYNVLIHEDRRVAAALIAV